MVCAGQSGQLARSRRRQEAVWPTVDFVPDNRIVFDLAGNKYRLVVHVAYAYKRVLVKFVGTHAEYDRIDVETVR